jgi:hypothetical protein
MKMMQNIMVRKHDELRARRIKASVKPFEAFEMGAINKNCSSSGQLLQIPQEIDPNQQASRMEEGNTMHIIEFA